MQESDLWNRHFSAGERRALNIVWAAAGDYDLEPPFFGCPEGSGRLLYESYDRSLPEMDG